MVQISGQRLEKDVLSWELPDSEADKIKEVQGDVCHAGRNETFI